MKLIKEWIEKTAELDDFSAAKSRISLAIGVSFLIILTVVLFIRNQMSALNSHSIVHVAIAQMALLISIFLNFRNPKNQLSGYLILFAIFFVVTTSTFYYGGLKTPGTPLFLILPITASFLINRKASLLFFALTMSYLSILLYLSLNGKLPAPPANFTANENQIRYIVLSGVLLLSFIIGNIAERIPGRIISEMKSIYDSHPSGIVKIDNKGTILYANKAFREIYELSHKNINDFFQTYNIGNLSLQKIWNSKESYQMNLNDGNIFLINFQKIINHKNEGFLYFNDVTLMAEKNNLERILAEKNAKSILIATYNHEINNPLMIAKAYTKKMDQQQVDPHLAVPKIALALNRIEEFVKEIEQINHERH